MFVFPLSKVSFVEGQFSKRKRETYFSHVDFGRPKINETIFPKKVKTEPLLFGLSL